MFFLFISDMENMKTILQKCYPDKPIYQLSEFTPAETLPSPFEHAIAVNIRVDQDRISAFKHVPSSQLDWYLLMESIEGVLYARGDNQKWELPCVYQGCRSICCPFLTHIEKNDWEALHKILGTSKMRWLLLNCILFIEVASRAHVQICGPIMKSHLDSAYPLSYKAFGNAKRKRPAENGNYIQSQIATQFCTSQSTFPNTPRTILPIQTKHSVVSSSVVPSTTSLLPPLKKIRICCGDTMSKTIKLDESPLPMEHNYLTQPVFDDLIEPSQPLESQRQITSSAVSVFCQKPTSQNSNNENVLPTFKKIRVLHRNALGDVQYVGDRINLDHEFHDPVVISEMDEVALEPITQDVITSVQEIKKAGKGHRRKKVAAPQVEDKRRAFDGSILIPHDDIFYGHSGWTHFNLYHTLMRNSHRETFEVFTDFNTWLINTTFIDDA
jgi:hypothetical protein